MKRELKNGFNFNGKSKENASTTSESSFDGESKEITKFE